MAYLRDIRKPNCAHPGCSASATHTLINRFNAVMGDYCRKHGKNELARAEKREHEHPHVRGDVR